MFSMIMGGLATATLGEAFAIGTVTGISVYTSMKSGRD